MLALSYVIIITIIFFLYEKIEDYERLGRRAIHCL